MTRTLPLDVKLMNWAAHALFAGFVALGLGTVALWAVRHPTWTLAGITVQGEVTHQSAVAVRAQLASRLRGSFLTLDLQEVKRLFEELPWVRLAVVQRAFPNRLAVTLTEHQAVAWWGEAGGGRLLNAQGEVFEATPDDAQADGWVELAGPDGRSAQVYALYQALRPVFAPLQQDITRLVLSDQGGWSLRLDGGAHIELGRDGEATLLQRAQQFVATWPQVKQRYGERPLLTADLRYPNGYALRMQGVTTVIDKPTAGAKPAAAKPNGAKPPQR